MKLDDLKIATKVMLPAIVLALVAVACVGLGVWQQKKLEAAASNIVQQRAPAELEMARFNRRVATIGYAAYRTVANEGASDAAKQASQEIDDALKSGNERLDAVVKADPSTAKDVAGFRNRFKKVYDSGRQGADLGLQDANEAGIMVMAVIDPDITALTKDVSDWTDKHTTETKAIIGKAQKDAQTGIVVTLLFGLISAAAALAYAVWIGRAKISRPLVQLSKTMEILAQGSVDVEVNGAQRRDEVGAMARSVQVFKDNALALRTAEAAQQRAAAETEAERRRNEQVREAAAKEQAFVMEEIATGLNRLAEGDLTYRVAAEFPADYKRLQSDFNGAIAQMEEAMRTIVHAANGIGAGSDEIASAADDLSRRSEQQAASLEETAAALDEITATVKRSSAGAQEASRVVSSTRTDAERSSVVVKGAVDAMQQIEKSSTEISQIIGVIDEIAFQTNLLALNAGVEAARAGDAGKGFAVVAQEVRALAQRSAEAAKEIKTLISTSSQQVNQGVSMVGQTGEALQAIVSKVGEIDALVSEIAASGQEQATGLNQVNAAVNQMDQTVQQNAAMVEQSTAASHSLKGEANGLMQMISRFQVSGAEARRASAGGGSTRRAAAPPPVSRPAPAAAKPAVSLAGADSRPGVNPVRSAQAKLAAFASSAPSDDWEEF
ncbi:methyl-accepting chemotaxis protein [Caulobacter radicis]|uniref:methyl-accepting chemotaxis protein n=1 Tax=Caulobacter radicis TaxID=2172650 RepID=UPI000D56AEC9|nr:HAMP domain-containing methyl-accepting chemotaxis protein [Caulobacter radicis]PVM92841.1 methyl-accepting chemotaxis protein [Caulobacter radicis]